MILVSDAFPTSIHPPPMASPKLTISMRLPINQLFLRVVPKPRSTSSIRTCGCLVYRQLTSHKWNVWTKSAWTIPAALAESQTLPLVPFPDASTHSPSSAGTTALEVSALLPLMPPRAMEAVRPSMPSSIISITAMSSQ